MSGFASATNTARLDGKDSARAATTADIVLSGLQTIDDVALASGDRVLAKDQADDTENGIYVAAAGAWSRSTDANNGTRLSANMYIKIEDGTANGDQGFMLDTNAPITVGTTSLNFIKYTGLGQVTAGDGLTKNADTIDAVANADGSIVVNADDIQVGVLATDAQHGNLGGGTLHDDAVAAGASGFMTGADKTKLDGVETAAKDDQTITAGAGMTGGGTGDVALDVVANADASIVVNADDIQVGVLATDTQHGARGGGTQHADVVAAGASGFMTGADKTKLDGVASGAIANVVEDTTPQLGGTLDGNSQEINNVTGLVVGSATLNSVAILQGDSTTKGFLPPRMTAAQRDAITAVAGLMIYNTDTDKLNFFNGAAWEIVSSAT